MTKQIIIFFCLAIATQSLVSCMTATTGIAGSMMKSAYKDAYSRQSGGSESANPDMRAQ